MPNGTSSCSRPGRTDPPARTREKAARNRPGSGRVPRAVELFRRAVPIAREAVLLPWRTADAEQNLRQAEAAAAAEATARG